MTLAILTRRQPRAPAFDDQLVSDMPAPSVPRRSEPVFAWQDPEAVNAARLAQQSGARERDLDAGITRFGQQQRLQMAADAGYESGVLEGHREGWTGGVRWGLFVGTVTGAIVTGTLFWLVMAIVNALGLQL